MEKSTWPGGPSWLLAVGLAMTCIVASSRLAGGYTTGSPQVRELVGRAIRYLEEHGGDDPRLGAQALVGIVLLKEGKSPRHPRIVDAANRIQGAVDRVSDPTQLQIDNEIYSSAQAIIFLSMLDPVQYRREINALLLFLQSRQKPHGGWGYPATHPTHAKTGDTSMTQNVVLSFWEATEAKVYVPTDMMDRVAVWLLKVQDPEGGYPYQGNPSEGFQPIQQHDIRPSMTAAGLGSLYILSQLLHVGKPVEEKDEQTAPPGLRKVEKKQPTQQRSRLDPALFRAALERGKQWFEKNYRINQGQSNLYYLYTLERYHSFRERAEGSAEKEPRWYNDGVRWLADNQSPDGFWTSASGPVPATAFGVLFLIRSTRISIEKKRSFGEGTLIGGRTLPKTAAGLAVSNGSVVSKPELGALDKMLAAVAGAETPDDTEALQALADLPSDEAEDLVSKHVEMLRDKAGDVSPEARLAAVRALAKNPRLDYVPTLIYALTDPDPEIVMEARDGLRRISRRFEGFGLPDYPALPDEKGLRERAIIRWRTERDAAVKKWRDWYLAIRPNAKLRD